MEKQVVARALITLDEDMALLLRRCRDEEHRPGEFDLPGGEKDPNESANRCVRREIEEETGLQFTGRQIALGWTNTSESQRRSGMMLVTRKLFVAHLAIDADVHVVLNQAEHDGYVILPVTDIAERLGHDLWSDGIRAIIAKAVQARHRSGLVAS